MVQREPPERDSRSRAASPSAEADARALAEGAVSLAPGVAEARPQSAASIDEETRYRLAVDAARLGTWTWDLATDEVIIDDRARELLALADGDVSSREAIIATRVHPDDRERVQAGLVAAADPRGDGVAARCTTTQSSCTRTRKSMIRA